MMHDSGAPTDTVVLDGGPIALSDIERIARRAAVPHLGPDVLARVARATAYADDVARTRPIYGRSTGVGANRTVDVTDPAEQALRLLRSHATSAGPLREPERVRAMLTVRLNQLAAGGNGISPKILTALEEMIVDDALPPVREWGGLGTADLNSLATVGLALMGEVSSTSAPPVTLTFGAGDALTFLSSNAACLGDAALAVARLRRLAQASLVAAAMTFVAVRGNPEAFAPVVESVTPFPGTTTVCRALRSMTDSPHPVVPARIQDPFGLRTLPQVAGLWFDALDRAEEVIAVSASTASENPALSPDLGVAHHGGFHAAYLGHALDGLRSATAQAAQLALGRTTMLADPGITGDLPFVADGTPGSSGTMIVEYAAAAALAEVVAGAAPAGLQTVTLSRGLEDGASFAALAAAQALASVEPVRVVLAAELLTAVRAVGPVRALPPALEQVRAAVLAAAPSVGERTDRDLTSELAAVAEVLDPVSEFVGPPDQETSSPSS